MWFPTPRWYQVPGLIVRAWLGRFERKTIAPAKHTVVCPRCGLHIEELHIEEN